MPNSSLLPQFPPKTVRRNPFHRRRGKVHGKEEEVEVVKKLEMQETLERGWDCHVNCIYDFP